jgi:hypothetical protein
MRSTGLLHEDRSAGTRQSDVSFLPRAATQDPDQARDLGATGRDQATVSKIYMIATASSDCIQSLADQVEDLADNGSGVWSLRIDDLEPEERRLLLDTHGRVLGVLRGRGHRVGASIQHGDDGMECVTISIAVNDNHTT